MSTSTCVAKGFLVSEDLLPRQEERSVVEVEEGVLLLETFGASAIYSGITVSSSVSFRCFSGVTRDVTDSSFNDDFGCLTSKNRGVFVVDFEIVLGLLDLVFFFVFEAVMISY